MKLARTFTAFLLSAIAVAACTSSELAPAERASGVPSSTALTSSAVRALAPRPRDVVRQQFERAMDRYGRARRAATRERYDEASRLLDEALAEMPYDRDTLDPEKLISAFTALATLASELGRTDLARRLWTEREHWLYRANHVSWSRTAASSRGSADTSSDVGAGRDSLPGSGAEPDRGGAPIEAGSRASGSGGTLPRTPDSPKNKRERGQYSGSDSDRDLPVGRGAQLEQLKLLDDVHAQARRDEAAGRRDEARKGYIRVLVLYVLIYGPGDAGTISMRDEVCAALHRMGFDTDAAEFEKLPVGKDVDPPNTKVSPRFGDAIVEEARRRAGQNDSAGVREMLEFYFEIRWEVLPPSAGEASAMLDAHGGVGGASVGGGAAGETQPPSESGKAGESGGNGGDADSGSSASSTGAGAPGAGSPAKPTNSKDSPREPGASPEEGLALLAAEGRAALGKCDWEAALTARRAYLDQLTKTSSWTAADLHAARRQVLALLVLLGHDDEADRLEAEMRKADR